MSSISLKKVVEDFESALSFTTGKKGALGKNQVTRIMRLALEAQARGIGVEPLGRRFTVPPVMQTRIQEARAVFDRVYPLCEQIVKLAERENSRKEFDSYSKAFIGVAGMALLIPINSRDDIVTSRPALYAMGVAATACAFQLFKYCQLPNRDAEKAELKRLWIALDGVVPPDLQKASMQMEEQMLIAKDLVNYVSMRLRIGVVN